MFRSPGRIYCPVTATSTHLPYLLTVIPCTGMKVSNEGLVHIVLSGCGGVVGVL